MNRHRTNSRPLTWLIAVCGLAGASALVLLILPNFWPIAAEDLPGTYYLRHEATTSTLTLTPNHHYSLTSQANGKLIDSRHGTWKMYAQEGASMRVIMTGFYVQATSEGRPYFREPTDWPALFDRDYLGRIRIALDPDLSVEYIKQ